jgi:hypothetical protein
LTIQKLERLLSDLPAGTVPKKYFEELFAIVVECWCEFSGSAETKMERWKVSRKMPEDVTWEPPLLSFVIERHGAAKFGSKRAERQEWTLDLQGRIASSSKIGFRQLRPNAPRLDVKGLADEVCATVAIGLNTTSRLVADGVVAWKCPDELMLFHGEIIGGDNKQTISNRRKRFIAELEPKLAEIGWRVAAKGRGLRLKKIEYQDPTLRRVGLYGLTAVKNDQSDAEARLYVNQPRRFK